jgi:hypothetical protein
VISRLLVWVRCTAELIMLVVLVATLILVPVIISASQVDEPHAQYPPKEKHHAGNP